jgi:hypothetical protein
LKASLNFLALSLVTGPTRPTGTSNGSFDGWIASDMETLTIYTQVVVLTLLFANSFV